MLKRVIPAQRVIPAHEGISTIFRDPCIRFAHRDDRVEYRKT